MMYGIAFSSVPSRLPGTNSSARSPQTHEGDGLRAGHDFAFDSGGCVGVFVLGDAKRGLSQAAADQHAPTRTTHQQIVLDEGGQFRIQHGIDGWGRERPFVIQAGNQAQLLADAGRLRRRERGRTGCIQAVERFEGIEDIGGIGLRDGDERIGFGAVHVDLFGIQRRQRRADLLQGRDIVLLDEGEIGQGAGSIGLAQRPQTRPQSDGFGAFGLRQRRIRPRQVSQIANVAA